MIEIEKPEIIVQGNDSVRLQARININGDSKISFMECDRKYAPFLVTEVADAFVWTAARYALIHHHDICSEAPISTDFFHNINYYFQSIALGDARATVPRITANKINFSTSGVACAAPISCGVDSLYTVKTYTETELSDFHLTHLFLTTQGLFGQYTDAEKSKNLIFERGKRISKELGLELILTTTNPHVFPQSFAKAHTHSTMFSIMNLRKLFSKFMYPSGYDLTDFSLKKATWLDAAHFDLLMSNVLTLPGFKVYSSGSDVRRLDKVAAIAQYPIAHRNLSVCIRDGGKNDNLCLKCKRTLLEIDAIGSLDNFEEVFDIQYYRQNRHLYFRYLVENRDDEFIRPLFEYFSIKEPAAVARAKYLTRPYTS